MNYLSHFVFNHEICALPVEPHFVLGVVLPDLWLRFSRTRRIRWRVVRAAQPTDALGVQLRAGLLNHVETDRRFHALARFAQWQRTIKEGCSADGVHPALVDFLAHMAVELALDHRLLRAAPGLVDVFYDAAGGCEPRVVAERLVEVVGVDTTGLDEIIRRFLARRFLRHYATVAGLSDVVRIVLALAEIPPPTNHIIDALVAGAVRVAEPAAVWRDLA